MNDYLTAIASILFIAPACDTASIDQDSVTAEEYSIYSLLINQENPFDESDQLFVSDSTLQDCILGSICGGDVIDSLGNKRRVDHWDDLAAAWQHIDVKTFRAVFLRINSRKYLVATDSLRTKLTLKSMPAPEVNKKRDWRSFYRTHAKSKGIIAFSRVAFDKKGQRALVLVENYCGTECGSGTWYLLASNSPGHWDIILYSFHWES